MNISDEHLMRYDSPYSVDSLHIDCPQSSNLKRRRTSDLSINAGDKRQRIDLPTSPLSSLRLAAFLAQASDCAIQQPPLQNLDQESYSHTTKLEIESGQIDNAGEISDSGGVVSDPNLCLRILSLPMLDSLSTQILSALAQGPLDRTISMVSTPESKLGNIYTTLKSLFEQVKKIYSQHDSFLSADALGIRDPEHRETIRRTNLATFVSNVFSGLNVRFLELDNYFLSVFTVDGESLNKEIGELFLDFKTQIYLLAVPQGQQERSKEEVLERLFPQNINQVLEDRHPGLPLSQSEAEFIDSFSLRRELLANTPANFESIHILSEKFPWESFLRQLGIFLGKEPFLTFYLKRYALNIPTSFSQNFSMNEITTSNEDNLRIQAELAAKFTLESLGLGSAQSPQHDRTFNQSHQISESYQADHNSISLPKDQTAPTQVLYERARQAAAARASPNNSRRSGIPSQRRSWTDEEERALMAGLDQVRGPHWSQILALYGTRGTINQVLKDRNQVQLKDKARNLKLFFLKRGIEVPYYLKSVTGELRTRAPSQATRREAEALARISGEEEKIRMSGIIALASGLRQHETAPISSQDSDSSHDEPITFQLNNSENQLRLHEISGLT